jgi:hypothetical protein
LRLDVECFHKKSHVLPAWTVRDFVSQSEKLVEIDTNLMTALRKQSSKYGAYWCTDCEKKSGEYDRYASLILRDKNPNVEHSRIKRKLYYHGAMQRGPTIEILSNVDFKKFQNFVFSVILRCELLSRIEGHQIIIKSHFDKMRTIYNDPKLIDDLSYPISIYRSPENDKFKNVTFTARKTRHSGHYRVEFRLAGFHFYVFTSSHSKPNYILQSRVLSTGDVTFVYDSYENYGNFKKDISLLTSIRSSYRANEFDKYNF